MKTAFSLIPVSSAFYCNGNKYTKQSARTGFLIGYNRVFYFQATEIVETL